MVAVTILAGIGSAVALAQSSPRRGGIDIGYTYANTTVDAGTQVGTNMGCNDNPIVVGGGVETPDGISAGFEVATSSPEDLDDEDSKPGDGWIGYLNNEPSTFIGTSLRVHVICAFGLESRLRRADHTFAIPAGKMKTAKQKCPGKTRVIGGGLYITGSELGVEVASFAPYDKKGRSGDKDHIPDDGFKATATSEENDRLGTVYAICLRKAAKVVYARAQNRLFSVISKDAECPQNSSVLDGAVEIKPPSKNATVSGSFPFDENGDLRPSEGWTGVGGNTGSKERKMVVWAMCLKGVSP